MRLPRTPDFEREVGRFSLQFFCEECAYFRHSTCAHEWPNREHQRPEHEPAEVVVFCKEFELR